MGIIDAYTHYADPGYLKLLSRSKSPEARNVAKKVLDLGRKRPNFIGLEERLKDLDRFGVDVQVTMSQHSLDPTCFRFSPQEELKLCREMNDGLARLMEESKGRICTMGGIPLSALRRGGLDEMDRAVQELGLKGFMVLTNVHGRALDTYKEFWARAAKLGCVVYIHPSDPNDPRGRVYEDEYDLSHVLGWPFETSLIVMRLIFSGILDSYPSLKIITHHMGGMLPFFVGRIGESFSTTWTRLKEDQVGAALRGRPVVDYFKGLYYDTAVGGNEAAIRCGYDVFGADRIVFSTDYPWGPDGGRGRLETYPKVIESVMKSESERRKVFTENAMRILDL